MIARRLFEVRLPRPLTGRSEEMGAIEAAIFASDASGIVVYGAAGVCKSRIAREALSAAESQGCECRWVVGRSSARAIPLGAFTALGAVRCHRYRSVAAGFHTTS